MCFFWGGKPNEYYKFNFSDSTHYFFPRFPLLFCFRQVTAAIAAGPDAGGGGGGGEMKLEDLEKHLESLKAMFIEKQKMMEQLEKSGGAGGGGGGGGGEAKKEEAKPAGEEEKK